MTPRPTSPSSPLPEDPLGDAGREPLGEAIASAREERRSGISVPTLVAASVASATASYTASHFLRGSAVLGAAVTPILVALLSEFIRRPVARVSATVAPVRARPPRGAREAPPTAPDGRPEPPPPDEGWAPVTYEARQPGWRPRWRLVFATGLLAFAIVVGVYTIPDLLVGHSITGAGGSTTFFSSGGGGPATTPAVTTPTTTTPTLTVPGPTTTVPEPQQTTTPTTDTTPTTPTTPTQTNTTPTTPTPTTPATPAVP